MGSVTGKPVVPHYPFYDATDPAGASPAELARRWRTFHDNVRSRSNRPLARKLGPLLGDDTRRRRWAMRLEQTLRPAHPGPMVAPTRRPFIHGVELLRRPLTTEARPNLAAHIGVLALDAAATNAKTLLDELARTHEWVLLVDEAGDEDWSIATLLWDVRDGADVIYADEDRGGQLVLKSAEVGPHSLLSENIIGRPVLVRSRRVRELASDESDAGSAAEWHLFLRLFESGAVFRHVPVVVSTAVRGVEAHDALRVVHRAFERRNVKVELSPGRHGEHVQWHIILDEWPAIEIVIPTRDRLDLLERCIASIVTKSSYSNYTITILDNDSIEPATHHFFETSGHRVVPCPGPFNYAAIMNRGVASAQAPFIVTLNNDTIVETADWLERLVGAASLDDVALVGCLQVDQHGHHDHDGIVIAPYPQHLKYLENWFADDFYIEARRNVAAVTGAVTMIRREAWERVGGMDESLAVVMNDVDLCLRLQSANQYVLFLPDVRIIHHASSSRGRLDPLEDRNRFVRRWDIFGSFVDPYFPERLRLFGTAVVATPVAD